MPVARRTELGLIVLVMLVTAAGYVLAGLGRTASVPAGIVPFLVVMGALMLAAHTAVRRFAPLADPVLLPIAALLNGIGYIFIARLDSDLAGLQSTWMAIAVGAFTFTLVFVPRARDLEHLRYTFALLGIGLLLLPLVPNVGRTINGARIWVALGPIRFQPGELAKIALAIFFASYLVEKRELLGLARHRLGPLAIPDLKHLGPIALAWGLSLVVMVAERDLGSSLLFFALFVAMLWVATDRAAWLAVGGGLFLAGALFSYAMFDHVQSRVRVWIDPWPYAADQGFQITQALFALGSGGLFGTGINLGSPEKIPVVATDFILAAIGEELGLLGTSAIVASYLLMVGVALRIAVRTDPPFEKLLAAGLGAILGLQAFIIIGGVTRLVPLTGITLPFVSYGGSSLVANYVLLALLLRMSDGAAQREALSQASSDETVGVAA